MALGTSFSNILLRDGETTLTNSSLSIDMSGQDQYTSGTHVSEIHTAPQITDGLTQYSVYPELIAAHLYGALCK